MSREEDAGSITEGEDAADAGEAEEPRSGDGDGGAVPEDPDIFGESVESLKQELFPEAGDGSGGEEVALLASGDAPWVGAEDKWLRGIDDGSGTGEERPLPGARRVDEEVLLVTEQLPKLPSLVPPPRSDRSVVFEIGIAVALLAVVGGAAGVVWWMNESFEQREREILELRRSDQQEVARLEQEIRGLMAKGGAENEARADELRAELHARQEAVAREVGPVEEQEEEEDTGREGGREHRRIRDSEGVAETVAAAAGGGLAPLDDDPYGEAVKPGQTAGPPAAPASDEDDLLDGAFTKPATAAAEVSIQGADEFPLGTEKLQAKPSRQQVKSAMDAVTPAVAKCGPGSGRIVVSVTVAGATGRVLSAQPTGEAVGTTVGLCAAKVVKLAKFPRFQQERLQIKYPFDL